jgi:hypothetical protein
MILYNQTEIKNLKPAVFLHIQKTAGTSIVDLARLAYGNDNVISHGEYFHNIATFPFLNSDQYNPANLKSDYDKISFISGHFGYDFAKEFMQERYSFTFLRNPIERVLSFYFFCKTRNPDEFEIYALSQQFTLDEFLELGFSHPTIKKFIWNCQVTQIAHGFGAVNDIEVSDRVLLKLAVKHLKKFSYVGFVETFAEDTDIILKNLGINPPDEKIYSNTNPNRPTFEELPNTTKALLMKLTVLDRALYKKAWGNRYSMVRKIINWYSSI